MTRGSTITPRERARLANLLRTLPLAEVQRQTGRGFNTLARIAAIEERAA